MKALAPRQQLTQQRLPLDWWIRWRDNEPVRGAAWDIFVVRLFGATDGGLAGVVGSAWQATWSSNVRTPSLKQAWRYGLWSYGKHGKEKLDNRSLDRGSLVRALGHLFGVPFHIFWHDDEEWLSELIEYLLVDKVSDDDENVYTTGDASAAARFFLLAVRQLFPKMKPTGANQGENIWSVFEIDIRQQKEWDRLVGKEAINRDAVLSVVTKLEKRLLSLINEALQR